jgi:hypothetical protein
MVGQAQTGKGKSIPKVTSIKADDALKLVYKNIGNNHSYPFIWADTVTVVSGTSEVVIASGVEFHGYQVATHGNITASPLAQVDSWYIDKDTVNNVVKIVATGAVGADTDFDVKVILGEASDAGYVGNLACRGNTGVTKNF